MLYFVINPNARSKQGWKIWKEIEEELKRRGEAYRYFVTKHPKDGVRIARKLTAGNKKRKIVVLGGDGTLNEFLNGMQRTKDIYLSYLPMGSGNDFARGMGISKDYLAQLTKILDHPRHKKIDYGIVTYQDGRKRRFFVSAGMGFDANVCYDVDHSKVKQYLNRFHLGKLAYLVLGIKNLLLGKTFDGTLSVDGRTVLVGRGFLFVSIHNLPYEGGRFLFAPKADAGDGKLNLCVAKNIKRWKIPILIPLAMVGKHTKFQGVYQFSCKEARIATRRKQYVHTDGETKKKETNILISVSKEKVNFYC